MVDKPQKELAKSTKEKRAYSFDEQVIAARENHRKMRSFGPS